MASGGGNRPTNLSFSLPSVFSSSAPLSSSLQTPDTNTFFLSSISGSSSGSGSSNSNSGGGKDASSIMLGNASPNSAGSQPFSSLEELLNVTGINSPGLGSPGSSSGGGVDSLQQLAKEVENKQLAATDLQPPVAKRPHLDLRSPSLAPPTAQLHQLPSNIRVQPLNFNAPSQTTPPSVTIASLLDKKAPLIPNLPSPSTLPPRGSLPSAPVTSTPVPVVPSLFSSVYQASAMSQQQQQHQLPTSSHQLNQSSSLVSLSSNLTAAAPTVMSNQASVNASPSSSFSFTTTMSTNLMATAPTIISTQPNASTLPSSSFPFTSTSSVSSLSQPFLPASSQSTISSTIAPTLPPPPPPPPPAQALGFHSQLPPTSTVGGFSSLTLPTQPSGQTFNSSSLPSTVTQSFTSLGPTNTSALQPQGQQLSLSSLGNVNTTASAASTSTASSATTSGSGTLLTTATSPVGGGTNANPLIQLVQMYKHFQSQGDSQGLMRVRQQLNLFVARQKIINAQNSLRAVSALNNAQSSSTVNLPVASSSSNATVTVKNVNPGLNQSQNPISSVGLGQMPQILQQSGQSIQQQQQPSGSLSLPSLPSYSTATSSSLPIRTTDPKPQQMPVTVSQIPPSMLSASHAAPSVASLGSTLPQANAIPPGMSVASSVTISRTPFNTPPPSAPATKVPPSTTTVPQQQVQSSNPIGAIASQSLQQQIIKRLQTVIASLPESQRPKTIPELKDFVQKYSSLITQNSLLDLSVPGTAASQMSKSTPATTALASTSIPPRPGPSSIAGGTRLSQSGGSIPSLLNSSAPMVNSNSGTKLSHPPSLSASVAPPPPVTAGPTQVNSAMSQSPSAQVAEHFKSSLAGLATSKAPMGQTVGGAVAAVSSVLASSTSNANPLPMGLAVPGGRVGGVGATVASTVHAPVTTQFSHKVGSMNSVLPPNQSSKPPGTVIAATTQQVPPIAPPTSTTSTNSAQQGGSGIQAGVATPLPPGVTLETLSVLCRLPESDLLKLKLPPALLSAIKVWKARQPPSKSVARASAATNRSSIPVLTASMPPGSASGSNRTSTAIQNQTHPSNLAGISPFNLKVGAANAASSRNYLQATAVQVNKASTSTQGTQPMVIPNSAGFPPRSLHAYIPGMPVSSLTQKSNPSPQNAHKHQTRYKTKVEQQKAETERLQALAKALQSSEEARIAFRFSAHLEKMHTQLLQPDVVTPFRSHHDILARLLPYHVYAEPEPPPAAVEKADAVFESVAQVLLSRSRGLTSRFQQIASKSDAEGGPEQLAMKMQLERLFIEGEQERIKQENIEKQQAEQIAADLSLMADGVDAFEPDFSLGDAFCPLLDMSDTGIT